MSISTSTGTLTAGQSRTFNLSPASAVTLTLSPNVRVTITETPATVAATGLGGNASRVHEPRLPGVVTYGPYPMGGSVLVENESNSGSSVAWVRSDSIVAESADGSSSLVDGGGDTYPINPIYTLPAPASMSGTTEVVLAQFAIAAGRLPLLGRLELRLSLSKSGTSETATIKVRAGTLGTTADTQIYTSGSLLVSTNVSAGTLLDFKRSSTTGLQKLGAGLSTGAYGGASTIAYPSEVTVGDMGAANYYVSITAASSSTVETVTLQDVIARLFPAA